MLKFIVVVGVVALIAAGVWAARDPEARAEAQQAWDSSQAWFKSVTKVEVNVDTSTLLTPVAEAIQGLGDSVARLWADIQLKINMPSVRIGQ